MTASLRKTLLALLGDPPPEATLEGTILFREEGYEYETEHLMIDLNGMESVPAILLKPLNQRGPLPVVLYQHSHGGDFDRGKGELTESAGYLQDPSFARELTAMGFAVLSIDHWGFEERKGKLESELVKEMLLYGRTLWGMRLFDSMRLLDYIGTREDLDDTRIATIGMSMGGLLSWWLAALDERVKVTIDIAAQVDTETLLEKRGLDHHGFYYYVPGLLKACSTLQIQEMIAPRPRLSLTGASDRMCPVDGARYLDEELTKAYAGKGRPDHWVGRILTGGHQETKEMRETWKTFLRKHL